MAFHLRLKGLLDNVLQHRGKSPILTKKGIRAASADFGLIALAYNLKRLIKLGWRTKNGKNHPNKAMKALFLASKILKNENLAHMTLLMKKNCLTPYNP